MMIESLQNRIKELESELSTFRQIAESTQQENETLRNMLKDKEDNAEVISQMEQFESKYIFNHIKTIQISCLWNGSGPMVQHYCYGDPIYIQPFACSKIFLEWIRPVQSTAF